MFSDVIALIFGILGVVFVLLSFVFKLIVWREENFTILLPLYSDNEDIYTRLCNIADFTEFCGIYKKCTIVIINYGASNAFCNNLKSYFNNYINLKIIEATKSAEAIFKESHT